MFIELIIYVYIWAFMYVYSALVLMIVCVRTCVCTHVCVCMYMSVGAFIYVYETCAHTYKTRMQNTCARIHAHCTHSRTMYALVLMIVCRCVLM
jgi:hypothetical protein